MQIWRYFFVNLGSNYIQTHLKQSLKKRIKNFMSIDWLPVDETKSFQHHV